MTAVRDKQPEAVVVSSVNGHGAIEGRELIERLRAEPAAAGVVAIIGGKLGITGAAGPEHARLLDAGFDAVIEAEETHDPAASMPQHLPQLEQAR